MSPRSRLNFVQAFTIVLILGFVAGCGGGGSQSSPMTVTLSPSGATLSVNSSEAIDASTTPALSKYTGSLAWSIQEYQSSSSCTEVVPEPNVSVPMANCPSGWLQMAPPIAGFPIWNVVYYSPATAGVYHVLAAATITNNGMVQYQGSATATFTVTAP